jgi:hypothetical protein
MTRGSFLLVLALFLAGDSLPARLSDQEFWRLTSDLSEPAGSFHSDNLLSNEIRFQTVIPTLTQTARAGGAYIGVGPEQNFTYIAALRPRLAFIVDVRRGNADLHLLYKALFELSSNRVDFLARLFSRKRPAGLAANASVAEIFDALGAAESSEQVFSENLAAIRNQLVTVHRFPLGEDVKRIEAIYRVFFLSGPRIRYSPEGSFGGTVQPTYADLMVATDAAGRARSYLASERAFGFVRDLQLRNLIVPIVGDFAGSKAIRSVGAYLKGRRATVSAFYVSNVEEYLHPAGAWPAFCANLARLPLDDESTLIRAVRAESAGQGPGFVPRLAALTAEVQSCVARP